MESRIERITQSASDSLREKDTKHAILEKRVTELEQEVITVTSRIAESSEYQTLLKRCEDAEAISRGLRFQLERARNEKKQLQKQIEVANANGKKAKTVGTSAETLFGDLSNARQSDPYLSPTSSVASGDLSNFDFFPSHASPPSSPPLARAQTSPATLRVSILPQPGGDTGSHDDVAVNESAADAGAKSFDEEKARTAQGTPDDKSDHEQTIAPTASSSTEGGKSRPGSGSINFFEKLSIKFKRTSPRNGASSSATPNAEEKDKVAPPGAKVSAPIDIPQPRAHILKERPRMYVAKSPSEYEESSDSIFGSESDSESSISDDESEPPPPPPRDDSPSQSQERNQQHPPPPPPETLFNEDSGESSDSDSELDVSDAMPRNQTAQAKPTKSPAPNKVGDDNGSIGDSSSSSESEFHSPRGRTRSPGSSFARTPVAATEVTRNSDSWSSDEREAVQRRRRRVATDDGQSGVASATSNTQSKRDRSRSTEADSSTMTSTSKASRMNEYMEARARRRQEKVEKKEEREQAEHKKREEYEKEWERMAQEERERRRKQQAQRRTGKRRPSGTKPIRVSQMRQQLNKQGISRDPAQGHPADIGPTRTEDENDEPRRATQKKRDSVSSDDLSSSDDGSDGDDSSDEEANDKSGSSPPLPPEPTTADTELYLRQQARLRERHEMELKKKLDADEADQVRGQIHRKVESWAFGKEFLHMILTLDQITTNESLRQCQLMVVQSPDNETLRKAYRNIIRVIHPDKLRGATIAEQLEAKELFTVLNQAFEKFKAQA
ncbi:hypothetical protein PINS_up008705 [Pythium insidiosum]|nr:hypothetical protein PINS_up008705 [Pythium insidiosum]